MKIIVIGAGNVATHLAMACFTAGHQIVQTWSCHHENAWALAEQVGAQAIKDLTEMDSTADFCLIAVKDDAIAAVVGQLSGFQGIVVHTSGAVSLNIFKEKVSRYGVFYPLQTFSKAKKVDFSAVPICLEANNQDVLAILREIALKLTKTVVEINSEKRKVLHLAAVFACNFTNHLYKLANDILVDHSLQFELIRPLISETASKIEKRLPLEVQTGPAVRDDQATMDQHLEMLSDQPKLVEIYRILSDSIKKSR